MVSGPSLRVSWICLLLFSSGACFPATKGDYRYPYTATGGSSGGSAPGSNLQSEGSRPPLVNLQYGPSATYEKPGAAPQQASFPTGNQSPSSLGAPSVATGSSPSYEPNVFVVSYDSSSNQPFSAPEVPSQGARYVSPTALPLPPTGTGRKTPSFSVQPQSAAGTSGNSNMGSGGVASGPVHGASPFPPSGFPYAAPALDFGDGPVPYIGAVTYGAGSPPYANSYSASKGSQAGPNTAATGGLDAGPAPYTGSTTSFRFDAEPARPTNAGYSATKGGQAGPNTAATSGLAAGPIPYGGTPTSFGIGAGPAAYPAAPATYNYGGGAGSSPGLPWVTQPAGGADASFYNPTDGSYPYAAPATFNSGSGAGSSLGLPLVTQPAGGTGALFSNLRNFMPSRAFPDLSVWDTNAATPQGVIEASPLPTVPLPPSSYIIQSRDGYHSALEVLSHTNYSPEYPEPPVFAYEAAYEPSGTPPVTGSEGGIKG